MSITLTHAGTPLVLHPDLYWSDEISWAPVEQSAQRTITGALIVSTALRVAGRPITLQPPDDQSAWMTRAVLDQLRAWAAVPGRQMTLNLRGQAYETVFRHHDGAAVEAEPVVFFSDVQANDLYRVTLRLLEI
ncbi:hypothetical protein [Methylibium rhizosphaerae]|uniref:hypothetical protein n=1 Tax=Methylibium rhizosphaerae TaxID=2570323 RepID=UPI001C61547A|nr:hypothetical protein [Methylibium rhizosphaerae]